MTGTCFIMMACFAWAIDTLIRYPLLGVGYSTLQIVFVEHLVLAFCTLPLGWYYRHQLWQLTRRHWSCLVFIGGVGSAFGAFTYTEAFHYLNPTVVILLQKLQPLVAIVLASVVLKEHIRKDFMFWAGVLLCGSLVMIWPDIERLTLTNLHDSQTKIEIITGYLYTLGAVVAWGSATVFGRYLSTRTRVLSSKNHLSQETETEHPLSPNAILWGRCFSGFLMMSLMVAVSAQPMEVMPIMDWQSVFWMACLSGLLGMWLYYIGLKRIPARRATLVELTFPVFAAGVNWIALDQPLSNFQIWGGFLLMLGHVGLHWREQHASPHSDSSTLRTVS